ncbi:hypothetical protein CW713_11735 [Methanophagales archaeon]|nr:MAG: hypothetical protein CW713_11735 [Methanophagales archaeon]
MKKKIWAISGIIAVLLVSITGLAIATFDPMEGKGDPAPQGDGSSLLNDPMEGKGDPAPQGDGSSLLNDPMEGKGEGKVLSPNEEVTTRAEVYIGSDKETAELVDVINVTSCVTYMGKGYAIISGRAGPYSMPAASSGWVTVNFPITFTGTPNVVWTNEVYPYTARAYYAIDRSWIGASSFDARITTVDALSNNYIQYFAMGPV